MSNSLRQSLYAELASVPLIDPHTHINALAPASETLADILGYHYYTELAHSAGMPKQDIEFPGLDPKEKVARLIANLGPIDNTIQHSWLVEMARELLGFTDETIHAGNWEPLYDAAAAKMAAPDWADQVLQASGLEAVFLTNDFDDPLEGFDTSRYIPCLRTDDLVFHLAQPEVRERFQRATGHDAGSVESLQAGIGSLFDHFARRGAKACAISLPPDFSPTEVPASRVATALRELDSRGVEAADSHRKAVANFVFWNLAQRCRDYRLPFDLMIGVNRGVYADGVHQGRDLYDSRVSLIQYRQLFNAFPQVTFPISVLASVTNQELTSYAWIFPNVVASGHWWYSNTPAFIEHDAAARLEAVPRTKQIGYYSDMYKLEFALPKFNMYKRILAKLLAERFVIDRGWSEEQALALGRQVLRDNVDAIFQVGEHAAEPSLPAAAVAPLAVAAPTLEQQPPAGGLLTGTSDAELRIEPPAAPQPTVDMDAGAATLALDDDDPQAIVDMDRGPASLPLGDGAVAATVDLESDPSGAATVDLESDPSGAATVDLESDPSGAATVDLESDPSGAAAVDLESDPSGAAANEDLVDLDEDYDPSPSIGLPGQEQAVELGEEPQLFAEPDDETLPLEDFKIKEQDKPREAADPLADTVDFDFDRPDDDKS